MSDLIKREDAITTIGLMYERCDTYDITDYRDLMIEGIKVLPSADRPQGKWKAKSFHEYFCNNCGFSFDMMKCEFLENMNYCPNCGVRKGADDE